MTGCKIKGPPAIRKTSSQENIVNTLSEKQQSTRESITALAAAVIAAVVIYTALSTFVCCTLVWGPSMTPTLRNGQVVVLQRMGYTPERGDIVSFYSEPFHQNFIKRVIGVEGDVIDIDFEKGIVYRNGEALEEDYTASPTYKTMGTAFPLTVEEGCVFVLGDNRDNSRDGRWPGMAQIPCEDIIGGKVLLKI